MTDSAKSFLVFKDYEIKDMRFERNYDYIDDGDVELSFDIGAKAHMNTEKNEAVIEITCKVFEEEFGQVEAPFHLNLSMIGYFEIKNAKNEEYNIKDFQFNGMAILFPYIRSVITSFTSQAGIPPVILPPINVYKALESQNEE